ncbi:MAG TPA: acyl-CoA dehydrogenase family protein [Hypericibacter adhaerens]|uniref:acyl-CoA dehydrogenase family protein n=1 Tax=Hypericibacter adhaerens TaxID=2602016 RepID=UPI002BAD1D8F|nr:acyl-CoA dehydrogenase family protein [Hypericibacter adhaerens]HWA44485.1 acyl-CoA dehydrogenase family protein [Hypericibacter adhaerens]
MRLADKKDFFRSDLNLQRLLKRSLGNDYARWEPMLGEFGAWVGDAVDRAAAYTDREAPPYLETYDAQGRVANRITRNPAWAAASREAYRRGVIGLNYVSDPAPFEVTFAMGYLLSQADVSLHCPVCMTGAVAYVLDRYGPPAVRARYRERLTRMDGEALTAGTWATELHGGSDVGGTTTVARAEGDHWRLNGLKWFVSNADGGLSLATARPEGAPAGTKGLGLYLVPIMLDDGGLNPMRFRRLKDKLGTVGVPTAEVDLTESWALEVAPPPDGFALMMAALEFSRIHNALASAGLQRRAFVEALHYAAERQAFGDAIVRYPMVQDELLAILVTLEAGTALAFEAARSFDIADRARAGDADETRVWLRLATALAKYMTGEDAIRACSRAIEIIGGNGYTYDHVTPRLLRDAQVMTVWEGPANIQALEILRLVAGRYGGDKVFTNRIAAMLAAAPGPLGGQAQTVSAALKDWQDALALIRGGPAEAQRHARRLMALMADILAGALLLVEAGEGLKQGDHRKSLILQLFIEARFAAPARRGILPQRDWMHREFEALATDQPIATAP